MVYWYTTHKSFLYTEVKYDQGVCVKDDILLSRIDTVDPVLRDYEATFLAHTISKCRWIVHPHQNSLDGVVTFKPWMMDDPS